MTKRKRYGWFCPKCNELIRRTKPKQPFMGSTHCCNCDQMLTVRTNGGQGNWNLMIKKEAKNDI